MAEEKQDSASQQPPAKEEAKAKEAAPAKEKAKAPGPKPTSQGLGAFALFRLSEGRALSELKTKKMERNLAR